jgi:DNA modification methylase
MFHHLWIGYQRDSEIGDKVLHPTQKPVELMAWCLEQCEATQDDIVCDPYCGSGPTLRAAKDSGMKAVGIEICEKYAEIAARRLQQEVLAL